MIRVYDPNFIGTPQALQDEIKAALAETGNIPLRELVREVPALKGKAIGEIEQAVIDSGFLLSKDDEDEDDELEPSPEPEPATEPEPEVEPPTE